MDNPQEISIMEAIAASVQGDGEEVAAIVLNRLQASADLRGDGVQRADMVEGVLLMLSGAWTYARMMHRDRELATRAYVELLRTHAANVELEAQDHG